MSLFSPPPPVLRLFSLIPVTVPWRTALLPNCTCPVPPIPPLPVLEVEMVAYRRLFVRFFSQLVQTAIPGALFISMDKVFAHPGWSWGCGWR